jgi:hypothetical protein
MSEQAVSVVVPFLGCLKNCHPLQVVGSSEVEYHL